MILVNKLTSKQSKQVILILVYLSTRLLVYFSKYYIKSYQLLKNFQKEF